MSLVSDPALDLYAAAVQLASEYRLPVGLLKQELTRLYGADGEVPIAHFTALAKQIEEQTQNYRMVEEQVDVALALIKPDGFKKEIDDDGNEIYTAEIVYLKDREHLLAKWEDWRTAASDFGFHYSPYHFDSQPEQSFFEQLLSYCNLHADDVDDIYFTGAITGQDKTDFFVEYKDDKGKWRKYTPDFVIRKKQADGSPGKCLIVEIKREHDREHPVDGQNGKKALAIRRWEKLNPAALHYEMIFVAGETIAANQLKSARNFIDNRDQGGHYEQ